MTSNGDGQSADGFGCHPDQTGDTGNVFRGCRAWWNTDDGCDFINASAACTVENSWTWSNGYKPDASSNDAPVSPSSGNGNGFKGGGYGMPPSGVPSPTPQHVLRFNVASTTRPPASRQTLPEQRPSPTCPPTGGATGMPCAEMTSSKSGCSCGVAREPAGRFGPMALLLVALRIYRRRLRD